MNRLVHDLKAAGIRTWVDDAELRIGDSLTERIGTALDASDYVAVVLSTASVESQWVRRELQLALSNEVAHSAVIMPLLLETVTIPHFLRDKVYADFTDPNKYTATLERLIKSIYANAAPHVDPTSDHLANGGFRQDLVTMLRAAIVQSRVYFAPGVPEKLLRNAATACNFNDYSNLVCVFDYSDNWVFAGGSRAIIVTTSGVHFGRFWDGKAQLAIFIRHDELEAAKISLDVKMETDWNPRGGTSTRWVYSLVMREMKMYLPNGRLSPQVAEGAIRLIELLVRRYQQ